MKIYSLSIKRVLEISDIQFEFLERVSMNNGDIDKSVKEGNISIETIEDWKKDDNFWSSVEAVSNQFATARVLTVGYLKDQLISSIEGSRTPTKIQMAAINASIKLLTGSGMGNRSAKLEITPNSFSVSFDEGSGEKDANQDSSQP